MDRYIIIQRKINIVIHQLRNKRRSAPTADSAPGGLALGTDRVFLRNGENWNTINIYTYIYRERETNTYRDGERERERDETRRDETRRDETKRETRDQRRDNDPGRPNRAPRAPKITERSVSGTSFSCTWSVWKPSWRQDHTMTPLFVQKLWKLLSCRRFWAFMMKSEKLSSILIFSERNNESLCWRKWWKV